MPHEIYIGRCAFPVTPQSIVGHRFPRFICALRAHAPALAGEAWRWMASSMQIEPEAADGELLHGEIIPGLGDGCVEYTLDAHWGFF